jgi:hypothetical protein
VAPFRAVLSAFPLTNTVSQVGHLDPLFRVTRVVTPFYSARLMPKRLFPIISTTCIPTILVGLLIFYTQFSCSFQVVVFIKEKASIF